MGKRLCAGNLLRLAAGVSVIALCAGAAAADESVVLQLRWDHQFQFAGYYAAKWQGLYEEAGLDVEIRSGFQEGGTRIDVVEEVLEGRADFGVGSTDVLERQGEGAPLVILSSVFQDSGVAVMSLADVPLDGPDDLVGLRIARHLGHRSDREFQLMLTNMGLEPADFPAIDIGWDFTKLLDGEVDAYVGNLLEGMAFASAAGVELNHLRPSQYGVEIYGDAIFARRDLLNERPGTAIAFVEASLAGWEHALEKPEEVASRIAELPRTFEVSQPVDFNLGQAVAVAALTRYPEVPLGATDPERWQQMMIALGEAQLIELEAQVEAQVEVQVPGTDGTTVR